MQVWVHACMLRSTETTTNPENGTLVLRLLFGWDKNDVCQANINEWMRCQLEQADLEAVFDVSTLIRTINRHL